MEARSDDAIEIASHNTHVACRTGNISIRANKPDFLAAEAAEAAEGGELWDRVAPRIFSPVQPWPDPARRRVRRVHDLRSRRRLPSSRYDPDVRLSSSGRGLCAVCYGALHREHGPTTMRFLEVFGSDRFTDLSLIQWMKLTPTELVVVSHLANDRSLLEGLPTEKHPVLPAKAKQS
jgi:hypothetical protein